MFLCEYCEIFKNSFFTEHLETPFDLKIMLSVYKLNVDLTLKLHLKSNVFQIWNFRFSLE